jgi:type I restriction enzyme M protein
MTTPQKGRREPTIRRRSIFDSLPSHVGENLYCRLDSLTNEASVETFFVNRLLADLGYKDSQIQTKKSIAELTVSLGGRRQSNIGPTMFLCSAGNRDGF